MCTDAASRGLDFPQVCGASVQPALLLPSHICVCLQVECVINFDFPSSVVDYLHRAGRTGRAGSKRVCQVVSLMVHRRDVRIALKLKAGALEAARHHCSLSLGFVALPLIPQNAAQSKSRVLHHWSPQLG